MTLREAVISVLNKEMCLHDIWNEIKRQNLYSTNGKTPCSSISALISTHIRKFGENSIFKRVKPGVYRMNK